MDPACCVCVFRDCAALLAASFGPLRFVLAPTVHLHFALQGEMPSYGDAEVRIARWCLAKELASRVEDWLGIVAPGRFSALDDLNRA